MSIDPTEFLDLCRVALAVPDLTADEPLAEVGVSSLRLLVLQSEIASRYGVELSIDALLLAPSVASVLQLLAEEGA